MIRSLPGAGAVRRGLAAVGVVALVALAGPLAAPYAPAAHLDGPGKAGPSLAHPLGTDIYNRDVLSRVLHGARISLVVAALSVLLSITLGTTVGLIAGFAGGATDQVLMRLVDAALSVPRVFLLLMVIVLWEGIGLIAMIVILGLTSWFGTSRLVRAEVLSARSRDYITAARSLGLNPVRIALRHLLPNVAGPVLVSATLGIGQIILIEAGLSYLGIGIGPPTPTLGNMIQEGQDLLVQAPWISIAPGLVIVATVLTFSALADRLERALDPRAGAA